MDKAMDSVEAAHESTSSNEQKRSSVEHQTSIFSQVSSLHSHSLMSNSQFAQVVFHDLDDVYPTDSDLHCRYTLTDSVQHTHGDRIALYKVGWKFVTDFVVFKLAPMPLSEKEYSTLRVAFSANTLPKDEAEWYQLCYVTADNMVIGASIPFEFRRPHESILKAIEDKSNPGLMVYKSRIALLHDKLANIEELKELAELKVYTLSNQISVLEKEVSSVSSLNKDLKQSLDHAKEDVDLLTKNLKCLNDEYTEIKSLNYKHEGELKVHIDEINRLKSSLDEKDTALSNLKSKLPSLEQFIVNNNKEKEELKACNIECEHLRNEVEEKEKEFKALQSEFNSLKQENVHSNLKLKEISNYNFRVKNDIDSLKQDNETLRAAKEIQHKLVDELEKELQNVKQQRDNQLASAAAAARSPTVPSESTNKMDSSEREYLQKQIRQLTELLEETLENQPLYEEDQKTYIKEIKSKLETFSQERRAHENEVCELNSIIKKQNDHIQKSNDQLKHFIGLRDKNENDFKNKIEELRRECQNITKINDNLFKRIRDYEQVERKFKELSDENNQLKSRLSNSEQRSGCSSGNIKEINEMKDVIKSLKEALVTEPCFEQFCTILFESTRVNAMNTYKDLYDSAQFIVFENPEIGFKVQRLLDEFGILKQDLDRRRQENENVLKELNDKKDELQTITLENESNKNKLVELKEVKEELENCLIAVKKENGNQTDGSKPVSDVTCNDHFEQIKKLTDDLALIQMKNHELQRQLKETKIQSALNNVGRISALSNQQSADNEVEVLKRRIKELEEEQTVGAPQKCCEMLQQRLNVSKIEYAKLYRRLASDKSHYESLISNMLGQASASPTASSSVAPAPTGSS